MQEIELVAGSHKTRRGRKRTMEDFRNLVFDIRYLTKHLPKHAHKAYEIIFVLDGELHYFVDERTYQLTPGSVICICANSLHQNVTLDQKKYKAIMIRYSKDFIQNHADSADNSTFFYSYYYKTRALKLSQEQSDGVKDLCLELFTEFNTRDRDYEYMCYSLLVQLLIRIKRIGVLGHDSSQVDYPNYLHMKVSRIAGYINGHYREPIALNEVAKQFHISEYYLSRNFRLVTGFSFNEYLNTTRVNMAKRLLKETNLNITRIAEEVGFNTITHFGRTFRKIVGFSPKAYRIKT